MRSDVGIALVRTLGSSWAVAAVCLAAALRTRSPDARSQVGWVGPVVLLCWAPVLAGAGASSRFVLARYDVPFGASDYASWLDPADLGAGMLGLAVRAALASLAWVAFERWSDRSEPGGLARIGVALVIAMIVNTLTEAAAMLAWPPA